MPLMRSPDGKETFNVPDSLVSHAQASGATMEQQGSPLIRGQDVPALAAGAAAVGGAAYGAGKLAQKVGPAAMDIAGELPVVGRFIRGGRAVANMANRGAKATQAAPSQEKVPASLARITQEDIAAHPQLKKFRPGELIRRATLEKVKLGTEPGSAADRSSTLKGLEKTDMRPGYTAAGNKQRSNAARNGRALERTKALRAARATEMAPPAPAAGEVAAELSPLEQQLQRSIAAQQAMKSAGLSQGEQSFVRSWLRAVPPPEPMGGLGAGVMREAAGPALMIAPAAVAILRHLLSGGDIRDIGDPENIRNLIQSTGIPMPPPEPQYGEPGYRGPI